MKYLHLLLPLMLTFLCTCVSAQESNRPAPVDTSLSIPYPHKLQLQTVGGLDWKGLSIQNARYSYGEDEVSKYCRFHVLRAKQGGLSFAEDVEDLTGDQVEYLKEDLNRLFVIAKSEKPQTYTSYRNIIGRKLSYFLDYDKLLGWTIRMSVGNDYDKQWFNLPVRQLPSFAKELDTCIAFTRR